MPGWRTVAPRRRVVWRLGEQGLKQDEVRYVDVGARMDAMPLTVLHLLAIGLCMFGFAFDLFEMALGSVLAAVFSTPERAVGAGQLSWLLASVYLGAIVGAPGLGRLADRIGRRKVLCGALAWLALTSLWACISPDLFQLTLARVLSGIALGAYPPLMMSYLTDVLPAGRRGPLILWAFGLAGLGLPAGVFFVRGLGPSDPLGLEAWRLAFAVGSLGSGVLSLLMWWLPESPRWLMARGRGAEAQGICDRFARSKVLLPSTGMKVDLVEGRRGAGDEMASVARSPWLRLAPLFLLSPLATVTFPVLMGTVLTLRGFQLSDALLFVGLSNVGPALGSIAASSIIDKVDRRTALCACALLLIVSGGAFVLVDSRVWLGAAAILFGIGAILYTTAINLYAAELFPTSSRAGSSALAWSFNRVGAAVSMLALLPLLKTQGPLVMFAFIAGSLVLSIGLLMAAPRGRAREPVA